MAGKVSTVKSTGSKRQDRQNPGSETGEGGSLLKGFYYNMTCYIFYILSMTYFIIVNILDVSPLLLIDCVCCVNKSRGVYKT